MRSSSSSSTPRIGPFDPFRLHGYSCSLQRFLGLPSDLFHSFFPTKTYINFSLSMICLGQLILLRLSPEWYLMRERDHEIPRYIVFSIVIIRPKYVTQHLIPQESLCALLTTNKWNFTQIKTTDKILLLHILILKFAYFKWKDKTFLRKRWWLFLRFNVFFISSWM